MDIEIFNIFVACGNLYPIFYVLYYLNYFNYLPIFLILSNASISFFMHLAESTDSRKGITPFCKYHHKLLISNSIVSTISAGVVIYSYWDNLSPLIFYSSIAWTNVILAEFKYQNNKIRWSIHHNIWHIVCYSLLLSCF